jgi:choline dehydrogenase-like flavoprotein
MPDQVSRKDFVTLFGTAVAVEALKTAETAEAATTHRALPAPPLGNEPEAYTFLTEPEAKFVEAAVERLIPTDAIMGSNPSQSVLNKYGQTWDVANVFVCGASSFPQNAGYNDWHGRGIGLSYCRCRVK